MSGAGNNMKISIAAVPYFWSMHAYQAFYQEIAQTNVDIVYLGETICSKRRTMKLQDWIDLAIMLTKAGKQVVLSTLTLIEAESELKALTRIASQKDFFIEANDMAAIQVANDNNNQFTCGSSINIYNNQSLARFNQLGMTRWCVPVELGKDDLSLMIPQAKKLSVELEYQVFGRMPLAYSARCFTARHHQLPKDACEFKCLQDEQGILVNTQEGDSFAQINGIQTQSAKVTNLIDRWQELVDSGIDILRIMPVSAPNTLEVIAQFESIVNGKVNRIDPQLLSYPYEFCNGYWLQIEGMRYIA